MPALLCVKVVAMKPSFALSLSFDGIRLLHRAAGGWRVVGDVGLDSTDLAGELAMLRKTATSLEPGGLRTKVLLPKEQVKYLSIDTPDMDESARRAAATIALDGATPYAVDDLAFDISAEGDRTHIAAVARETLAEAEGFASDHRFNPVSFATIPGDETYLGEPFFGVTSAAADLLEDGETVTPDGIAVVVIGDITPPDGPVATAEDTVQSENPDPAPPPLTVPDAKTDPAPDTSTDTTSKEPAAEPQEDPIAPAPVAETPAAQAPDAPGKVEPVEAAPIETKPQIIEPQAPPPEATVSFSSRRAEASAAPALAGVTRTGPQPARPESSVTSPTIDIAPEAAPAPPAPETAPAAEVEAPKAPAEKTGFLSRRRSSAKKAAPPIAAPVPELPEADGSEQDRMTVFGARKAQVGGKPRFLGLILTAALLVFLAGVAAWASVFLDDGISLSRLFGDRDPKTTATAPAESDPSVTAEPGVQVASLEPTLSEEDAAVLDALRDPVQPAPPPDISQAELEAKYAATGIWPRAPQVPPDPAGLVDIDDLYITSIDPVSTASDALALPAATAFDTDTVLASVSSPAAAGTVFALDANGLVIPTVQGALSPEGFTVFRGAPPLVPPATPTRFQSEPEDTAIRSALAAARPQPRPAGLVENSERAQLGGLTRSELATYRPALRPQSLQQQAEQAAPADPPEPIATDGAVALALTTPSPFENATKRAAQASLRPDTRPRNFSRIVQRAQRNAEKEEVRVASAATIAPRTVAPKIPSKTSVAKQATVRNALNLRKVNLIGVYGKPSSRRALVRLGNGRYKKVEVGDRIDGGRVSAIGEGELRYTKRGRNLVLKMPR